MEFTHKKPRPGATILEVEVPNDVKERIDEYAASKDFGSIDNFVNSAIGHYFGFLHARQEAKK